MILGDCIHLATWLLFIAPMIKWWVKVVGGGHET